MSPRWSAPQELAAQVSDGDSIAVGGTLFTRVPLALLVAVAQRKPQNLHYVSWGGGFPLEMLLEAKAVGSATLCFSSLDVFGQAPRFRAAVESGELPLVELTAHALHQGLSAGRRRLPSEPMIWPRASDLTTLPGFPSATRDPVTEELVGASAAIRPDVFLLHAQAADEDGNIEIVGARGVDLTALFASRKVLVTVERLVDRSSLGTHRNAFVIPKKFVSAISHTPGGAGPTSCLPYSIADYSALRDWADAPSPIAWAARHLDRPPRTHGELPAIKATKLLQSVRTPPPLGEPTVDEWLTVWLARQYDSESICSVGAVSPLATASYLLAKATHAPGLTLITNGGAYVDVGSRPLAFGIAEWLDAQTAVAHMGGEESYEVYYQAGYVTHEVVSVAQIDARARTNNRIVQTPGGRSIRLPGQGGMADVADMHRDFFIYLPRQSALNTPELVGFATAARGLMTAQERKRAGYQPGRVRLVTNLAAFELEDSGRLAVREVFPWTTISELRRSTGFDLGVEDLSGVPLVTPPSAAELRILRETVDPMGLRRLEFVASKDRGPLLAEILSADEQATRIALDDVG